MAVTASEAEDRLPIDRSQVQRLFARRRLVEADDFLQREVARRMIERLATVRVEASRVVDLGCGTGRDLDLLAERFPGAMVCGLDFVLQRLQGFAEASMPTGLSRFFRRPVGALRVQADFASLPFAAQTVDVLWSNLALHWSSQPHLVLPEWSRVARIGGLVAFSAFGPDTLREVADAFGRVDSARHVMPFTDMHDYGDMLISSGFATPVVDMERLSLTYTNSASLWRDVRALGGNALLARARGLRVRDYRRRVEGALEATRRPDGHYALTFELVFAHAWKGEPRTTSRGETIVRMQRPR